jgi:hypothetical protein
MVRSDVFGNDTIFSNISMISHWNLHIYSNNLHMMNALDYPLDQSMLESGISDVHRHQQMQMLCVMNLKIDSY